MGVRGAYGSVSENEEVLMARRSWAVVAEGRISLADCL